MIFQLHVIVCVLCKNNTVFVFLCVCVLCKNIIVFKCDQV